MVETTVITKSFSGLMKEALEVDGNTMQPHLILIDTEGFDCKIVKGISPSSYLLPEYLIYEHSSCGAESRSAAVEHLSNMGYRLHQSSFQNTVAVKSL
jgi:hypothetical protein